MEVMVEESDLSLVSLAQPAIELKQFKFKVSAKLSQGPMCTRLTRFVWLYQNWDKIFVDQKFIML